MRTRQLTTDGRTTDHGPQDYGRKVETLTPSSAASKSPYVFRWTGRDWEVVFGGGRAFHLPNVLGARYLDHFLHQQAGCGTQRPEPG